MTKKEHITYWISSAQDDLKTIYALMKTKRYVHALFFGHLHLEKISKALWVKNNKENYPPRIHNIIRILEQANIQLDNAELEFIDTLNEFQLQGRYPDYINSLHKKCNRKLAEEYLKKIKNINICLQEKLQ